MLKYYLHIDQRTSCSKIREFFEGTMKEHISEDIQHADIILVWGWDGWMLQAMRKCIHSNKVLVGVNCWTLGFMLNERSETYRNELSLDCIHTIQIRKINVEVTHSDATITQWFFFNDCVVWNHVVDYSHFQRQSDQWVSYNASWTWLVVTSMLWSTWYALNVWQPIIPVDANLWWIVWIATAPFKYQYIQPQNLVLTCKWRTTIHCGLDGRAQSIDDVASVRIIPSVEYIQLWFVSWNHFATKRVMLAQQKMWA